VHIDRLAAVGADGNIYTMDRNGGALVQVTSDVTPTGTGGLRRLYLYPNWSPDGRQMAYVGVSSDGQSRILTTGPRDAQIHEVFSSADRVPIYLSWSPDSRRLAFLAQNDNDELALEYANGDGSPGGELGKGSPFYFSWAPDSGSLISHVGGSRRASADAYVGAHAFDGAEPRSLDLAPSNFLAPAFSPDGREVLTAIMGATENDNVLVASDRQGSNPRTIAKFGGFIAFAWSPNGRQVAYLVTPAGRLGQNSQMHMVDADGRNDRVIADDSPIAFFWSPDGSKLAYLTIARGTEGRLLPVSEPAQQTALLIEWKVFNTADGAVISLARFTPTDQYAAIIPYSDQYGQSLRIWSPDSTALVYAARDRDNSNGIYVVDIARGESRRVASGTMAAWSWQ
jgi:TolB protein